MICKEVVDAFGVFTSNGKLNPATGTCSSLYVDRRSKRADSDSDAMSSDGGSDGNGNMTGNCMDAGDNNNNNNKYNINSI